MNARIVISPNGELSVFVASGTFETAKPAIEKLLAQLKAQGLNFSSVGIVESHHHDTQTVEHTQTHTTTS